MTASPAPWTPAAAVAVADPLAVDALLDDAFRGYGYRRCTCGSQVEPPATVCHACATDNRRLGPLYGGSLAGATAAPCHACALHLSRTLDLLDQNDALAHQVAALQAHAAALAAQVRAGKGG